MRVNCQLERQRGDSEGHKGHCREEDKECCFYSLTGRGEFGDIVGDDRIEISRGATFVLVWWGVKGLEQCCNIYIYI